MLQLAQLALRRPLAVLAALALATAVLAAGLFRLELRTDGAALYPAGDPQVAATLKDRDTFQESEQVILLVTSRPGGPLVASPEGFRFLHRAQRALEALRVSEPLGVRSVVGLIEPPKPGEKLDIHTFYESWDGREESFPDLLRRVRAVALAGGLFLAPDGRAAPIYVAVRAGSDRREVIAELRRWSASRAGSPFTVRITGPVAAEAELGEAVLADLARLVPAMVGAVALLLWLTLRTPGGVIIPLAQVVATLLWTLGLMGWCRTPITLVTTVMPVLLMAMAMTDEIYLIERLRDHLADPGGPAGDLSGGRTPAPAPPQPPGRASRERVRQAAGAAFADLQAPLVLISLATAAGFFSFLTAAMAPLRHLGLFTGLGLVFGMLFTFTLAPALMVVLPPGWLARPGPPAAGRAVPELAAARRSRSMALIACGLVLAGLPGLLRLRVQDSWIENFAPHSPLVSAEKVFNAELWGSYRFDIVLAGEPHALWTARGIAAVERLERWAAHAPFVGGCWSVLPLDEAAARAQGREPPLSALPETAIRRAGALVEVLRLRVHLSELLTLDQAATRARLFVKDADYARASALRTALAARLPALLAGSGLRAHTSGDVPLALAVVEAIVGNQLRSIGWTALLVALMLLAALRSLRWVMVVMAPVLAATLLLFAGLGYSGVPLGIATSMFAALNLGAGVDFAVQYVYAYRRSLRAGGRLVDHDEAVRATLLTTGRGLRWNAVVLSCGLAVLALSAMGPNRSLGILLSAAMAVSYLATLALLPELLRRLAPAPAGRDS